MNSNKFTQASFFIGRFMQEYDRNHLAHLLAMPIAG